MLRKALLAGFVLTASVVEAFASGSFSRDWIGRVVENTAQEEGRMIKVRITGDVGINGEMREASSPVSPSSELTFYTWKSHSIEGNPVKTYKADTPGVDYAGLQPGARVLIHYHGSDAMGVNGKVVGEHNYDLSLFSKDIQILEESVNHHT